MLPQAANAHALQTFIGKNNLPVVDLPAAGAVGAMFVR